MKTLSVILLLGLLQSCANYKYAQKMKTVSFSDDLSKGTAVGQIRGEDCTWSVLGNPLGMAPTVDKAFINTRNQASQMESSGLKESKGPSQNALRYVNNVTTEKSGFNAYVVSKDCLVVTGAGYR